MKKALRKEGRKMKQKRLVSVIGMLVLLISIMVVTGCSSMRPIQTTAQFPADGSKYVILGRVKYEGKMPRDGAGYTKLLEVAKEKYPNTDDVVNIIMDERFSYPHIYGITPTTHIIMSGIAIQYLK